MDITRDELAARLGDDALAILDVRSAGEYSGDAGYPCDPQQGHIPGALHLPHTELLGIAPAQVRELVGLPDGAEIAVYCHSGSRSALAATALRAAGYEARNYAGSWHEWARDPSLPAERG